MNVYKVYLKRSNEISDATYATVYAQSSTLLKVADSIKSNTSWNELEVISIEKLGALLIANGRFIASVETE